MLRVTALIKGDFKMKKIISTILATYLVLSLVGCGSVINSKGEPSQEVADSVMNENHSGATFKEKIKSKAGEEDIWTFYYEKPVKAKITSGYTTYAVEFHYNEEAKQWDYSPVQDIGTRYDWDIEGTWHPIMNEYRTWYATCVMTIGKIENDQVHITFEKDGVVHFDETIPFNNERGTSFTVHTTNSMWQNIDMYILPTGVGADRNGTRSGCDFERTSKPIESTSYNNTIEDDTSSKTYKIATKLDKNYVLNIENASKNNGGNLELQENSSSASQKFELMKLNNGYYMIININSGMALTAENNGTVENTNVCQQEIKDSLSQQWSLVETSDNCFYIIEKNSGLYLDVDNAWTENGTNVKLFSLNTAYEAQKWILLAE